MTPRTIHLGEFAPPSQGTSVALGFFDGVHRGHQVLLQRALQGSFHPLVFTFRNHPASVVSSSRLPQLVTDFSERCQLLMQAGMDVIWTDFDRPFSQLEPQEFIDSILVQSLGARRVVSGDNYRFGFRASGTPALLRQSDKFAAEVVEDVLEEGEIISSSRIRQCLLEGQMARAHRLLGRPYRISGRVLRGDQIGRKLAAPTANLALGSEKMVPRYGVYAVRVLHKGAVHQGAANLGVRPTVTDSQNQPTLEVHLLDFQADLYGEPIEVDFVEWIRGEERFPDLEALKAQIHADIARARQLLN